MALSGKYRTTFTRTRIYKTPEWLSVSLYPVGLFWTCQKNGGWAGYLVELGDSQWVALGGMRRGPEQKPK